MAKFLSPESGLTPTLPEHFATKNYVDTLNHTGDVTGSIALTIANSAVSLIKLANLPANTMIGNDTAGALTPKALTITEVKTWLGITDGAYLPIGGGTLTGPLILSAGNNLTIGGGQIIGPAGITGLQIYPNSTTGYGALYGDSNGSTGFVAYSQTHATKPGRVEILVGSAPAVTILPTSGNVLVGTTTDRGQKLQIRGPQDTNWGQVRIESLTNAAGLSFYAPNGSDTVNDRNWAFQSNYSSVGFFEIFRSASPSTAPTTPVMALTGAGNVLIGTVTDSGTKVQIVGSILLKGSGALASQNISFSRNDGSIKAVIGSYYNSADEGNLEFITGTSTTKVVINSSGNMLIGTTADRGKKLVVTADSGDGIFILGGQQTWADNQPTAIIMGIQTANYSSRILNYTNWGGTVGTRLQIQTHGNANGVWNIGLFINETGAVSIGTTTSVTDAILTVAGGITDAFNASPVNIPNGLSLKSGYGSGYLTFKDNAGSPKDLIIISRNLGINVGFSPPEALTIQEGNILVVNTYPGTGQTSSPRWLFFTTTNSVNGNVAAAGIKATFGRLADTDFNSNLLFFTAGDNDPYERMRITNLGNLLIGTTTDNTTSKVQIYPATDMDGLTILNTANMTALKLTRTDTTTRTWGFEVSSLGNLNIWDMGTKLAFSIQKTNGFVGIGTSYAQATLELSKYADNSGPELRFSYPADQAAGGFAKNVGKISFWANFASLEMARIEANTVNEYAAGDLRFYTRLSSAYSLTERLRIYQDGTVETMGPTRIYEQTVNISLAGIAANTWFRVSEFDFDGYVGFVTLQLKPQDTALGYIIWTTAFIHLYPANNSGSYVGKRAASINGTTVSNEIPTTESYHVKPTGTPPNCRFKFEASYDEGKGVENPTNLYIMVSNITGITSNSPCLLLKRV
jgi:hypothetical protein